MAGAPAVRNAGNLVPHAKLYDTETVSTEPAALELGCIVNGIKNVIVCGHSDCKVSSRRLPATSSIPAWSVGRDL